jgi:hypothetical protein
MWATPCFFEYRGRATVAKYICDFDGSNDVTCKGELAVPCPVLGLFVKTAPVLLRNLETPCPSSAGTTQVLAVVQTCSYVILSAEATFTMNNFHWCSHPRFIA